MASPYGQPYGQPYIVPVQSYSQPMMQPQPYGMQPVQYAAYSQQPSYSQQHMQQQQQSVSGGGGGGGRGKAKTSSSTSMTTFKVVGEDGVTRETEWPLYPPGMEYLEHVDRLFIHQEFEILECLFCLETNNEYMVQNANGQICFRAAEDTNFWQRCLCCSNRGFQLNVFDGSERQVLTMKRSIQCCTANFCCVGQRQEVELFDMEARPVGSIRQDLSCLVPTFLLLEKNPTGEEIVLIVRGPRCMPLSCCSTSEFRVYQEVDDERRKVGSMHKKYGGCFRETCTDADEWGIHFPKQMPIRHKALVLAASLFLDYLYFENGSIKDCLTCHF